MEAYKMELRAGLIIALSGMCAEPAVAQGRNVEPHVVSIVEPSTLGASGAGWAVVRYSVLANGQPGDIRVLDVVPPDTDSAPIVAALERWVFQPGMANDEAVVWHNLESVIAFGMSNDDATFSDVFASGYASVGDLLEAESYGEALTASGRLLDASRSRSEIGLALAQSSLAHIGRSDWHSALRPLQLATDPRMPSLPEAELLSALQLRFQVEVELGRRREALDTYERIDYALDSEAGNPYEAIADQLGAEWETVEALPVLARVDDQPWRIAAARRTFAIADVEGELERIDVECDRRQTTLAYQANAEWSLPESWGRCELFIGGEPGTTFVFYELLELQEPPD